MANEKRHTAMKEDEERFNQLAQKLGQTPEALLRDMVDEKEKEWALTKLDKAVAEADASGSAKIEDLGAYFEGIKAVARRRNAHPTCI